MMKLIRMIIHQLKDVAKALKEISVLGMGPKS